MSPDASYFTAWRGSVPAIPASRLDPVSEDGPLLLWVRHGLLTVQVEGQGRLTATTGRAVCVPSGVRHSAELAPGSVALPVLLDAEAVPDTLDRACVVTVPPDWSDWLVHLVARWFGITSGPRATARVAELLAGARSPASAPGPARLPRLPRSPGPRDVVERLVREPACGADLVELAAVASTSPRTLQRRLRAETGHSLAQWRTAVRVDAAATHLAAGRDLEWTAHHVGYATLSSFARAFKERVGVSPGRFALRPVGDPGETARPRPLPSVGPAPEVPAGIPTSWVAPFDSVLWVYRGSARLALAGGSRQLGRGDVVWLGRGSAPRLETPAGSIVLPLGLKPGGPPVGTDGVRVLRMPDDPDLELYLLHLVVANHFLLRPRHHDDQSFLELLHPAYPAPDALPDHLATLVSALIEDPADRRGLTEWAEVLGVDALTLRRDFARHLGEPFVRWRSTRRMSEARALMGEGVAPSSAARRLGYAHLSAFSKEFATAHGVPPREWLRLESG